jgi:hypothetical protein
MSAAHSSPLRDQIRTILLADWDPNNASRFEAARGEYDNYLSPLQDLILSGAGEDDVIEFLYAREREIMCFPGLGKGRLRRVARKLLTLRADNRSNSSNPV